MGLNPSLSPVSRRDFLRALPASALMASCRRRPYRAEDFRLPPRSAGGLFAATGYGADFTDLIGRGLSTLRWSPRGRRVLLKPNMIEYESGTAINTSPLVVAGAAAAMLRAGASQVVVGEGPGHRRDIEFLLGASGLGEHLHDLGIRFADLNHDDVRLVALRSRFMGLAEFWLPASVLDTDLVVSVAKLKTHHWAGMTASMKNLFGVVPGAVYGWPKNLLHVRGIEQAILDLSATIRPSLAIVDAVVAMEGDGPIMGRPRELGLIAMGTDPVAVDATCARIIGLDPTRLGYLEEASRFLGHIDDHLIDQLGESPDRFQTTFELLPHLRFLRAADRTVGTTQG